MKRRSAAEIIVRVTGHFYPAPRGHVGKHRLTH